MSLITRFGEYLAVERHYSPHTVEAYLKDLRIFCEYHGIEEENFNPNEITFYQVRKWVANQVETFTPRTARRRLSSLHSFWRFLLKTGQTQTNPVRRVSTPKINHPLPTFFKPKEIEAALSIGEYADDFISVRDSLLIQMLYETGFRRAEICSLTNRDIDLHTAQIRVFGKRRKERIVPIGNGLITAIQHYLTMRNDLLAEQNITPALTDAFFINSNTSPLTYSQLYPIVHQRMSEFTSQKKVSPHVLRHTFATTMLNNGADINSIKQLLGHANLAATQIYTHTTFEQIRDTYNHAHPRAKKEK